MAATRAATCLFPLLPPKTSKLRVDCTISRDDNRQMCREKGAEKDTDTQARQGNAQRDLY